ncbi:hypothetical protein A3K48_07200 [candidate division WOR-1 bacterium RIFOXYA12_FULL_52_29]|uniref:Uncharacterized protein n=1 Tax=candidate division WOR-1 bacterium RIFOXYC12_FULL_54_18 TaxID=1802584 RepID=A0A1F4T7F9_UNCSA|nr:MAG: hypothetical protein A3K44_07200 [candidate division WOR-1 bacterium RIFOXYA2_FULL_51_19]OGC18304.1 MAG: hypothetical protein A3K48_07200 [candidate division WOR-1 bacterium RIFOXYA12_FULL_52_29]OGC27159.1 MAG: hypothetical protein A3K32_07195 [candidate division WOR-1 bacterium RIFOXYB2_FULL_45_9]OGC28721.1 MAG: hypothetical protein A3K49_07200 [candidate division WOR-1 bacterium RIFOXYC12_FULL_54_18]OGC30824.1 MAG: hypothetical protein A2346_05420 [candidate division WOR-1 bacterium R
MERTVRKTKKRGRSPKYGEMSQLCWTEPSKMSVYPPNCPGLPKKKGKTSEMISLGGKDDELINK